MNDAPVCTKCNDSGMIYSKAIVYNDRTGIWDLRPVAAYVPCQACDRATTTFTEEFLETAYNQLPDAWKRVTAAKPEPGKD